MNATRPALVGVLIVVSFWGKDSCRVPDCRLCTGVLLLGDALRAAAIYRHAMQFPDSTFAALNIADEPLRIGRLLALALVLTLAAVAAGLLVGGA